jgi:competence protein ComGF
MIFLLIIFGILAIVIPITIMEIMTKDYSEKDKREAWENFFNQINK